MHPAVRTGSRCVCRRTFFSKFEKARHRKRLYGLRAFTVRRMARDDEALASWCGSTQQLIDADPRDLMDTVVFNITQELLWGVDARDGVSLESRDDLATGVGAQDIELPHLFPLGEIGRAHV